MPNNYIKYSALVFQMAVTIGVFLFIGKKVDQYFQNNKPILTAIFSVLGVLLAIYNIIKSVNTNNK